MKTHSNPIHYSTRDKLIGLGEKSIKKSYYPELKKRLIELERFRTLLDEASDAIFLIEIPTGYISDMNQTACRLTGFSRENLMNLKVFDLISSNVQLPLVSFLTHQSSNKNSYKFTTELKNKSTLSIQVEFNVTIHTFNNVKYGVAVVRDITERIQSEIERNRLQEQLRQAMKMEALGKLTGGIAHDFNNLLHAMMGYIQLLLLKKNEAHPDYRYLAGIKKAAERAADIVRRLLTFSRKMEPIMEVTDLNDVVNNTVKILERTYPKMISFKTYLYKDLMKIKADPTQLVQVLMNLAGNSKDAMPDGGTITIETTNISFEDKSPYLDLEPGKYVLLKVSDTGYGIKEKIRSHIFEPFFTTKEVGKGTGLGLSIVYGIIKNHQGYISCYSDPDQGTTFKIYLPATSDESFQFLKDLSDTKINRNYVGSETILSVDDEEFIQEITTDILSQHGYSVIKAMTGEQAIEIYKLKKDSIDLIILDLSMPGMGGEKSLKELLKINPHAKIIISSGYAAHQIAKNPWEYGAIGFICKPFVFDDFLSTIKNALHPPMS